MVVRALPNHTISLIKSTQVITNPTSIVKELVENGLDAGATAITIKMEKFGFCHLEVRDNGSGIRKEDVEFIAKPHYTSKISAFSDLACLTSYGFRGEALASLCTVSDLSVTTKTNDDTMGHTYTFNQNGNIATVKPAAATTGTTIIVTNLFKNIPVRRQFYNNLKRRKEEMKKVEDLVLAFSLAAPTVHFTLSHEKSCIVQKSSAPDLHRAIINTLPAVFKDIVKREDFIDDISVKIEAYLPKPESCNNPSLTRSSADRLFILVNGRPITHKPIEKVVKALYISGQEGSHSRYPVGVLALTLPPESLDVNLEPNKTRVLFKDENEVVEALKKILTDLYHPTKADVDIDISCTLSCITQPQSTNTTVRNENKNPNTNVDNENIQQNISNFSTSKEQDASIMRPAGLRVMGRSEHGISEEKEFVHSLKSNLKSTDNIKSKVYTSTQDSVTDATFPSISECVTPIERRSRFMDVTDDFTPARINSSNLGISGIEALDFEAIDTVGREKRSKLCESFDFEVGDKVGSEKVSTGKLCEPFDLEVSDMAENGRGKGSKLCESFDIEVIDKVGSEKESKSCVQNRVCDTSNQSEQNTSKHHESIMGSDGIPVFLIPPIIPDSDTQNSSLSHSTDTHIPKNIPVPKDSDHFPDTPQNQNSSHSRTAEPKSLGNAFKNIPKIIPQLTDSDNSPNAPKSQNSNSHSAEPSSRENATNISENTSENRDPNQNSELKPKQYTFKKMDQSKSESEAFEVCEPDKSSEEEGKGGSWSRGEALNGKNIQTVQLLTPSSGNNRREGQEGSKLGKRDRQEKNTDQNTAKKAKINSLGPTRFDFIGGKQIKKPSSPFLIFSREIRSQVLSEHPGADFGFIAQELATRWKALTCDQKAHYNNLAKEESEKYQEQIRKFQESRGLNTSFKLSSNKGGMTKGSLDRYVAPMTPNMTRNIKKNVEVQPKGEQKTWQQNHTRQIPFTVNAIKKKLNRRREHSSPDFSLIGCVGNGSGGWLCMQEGTIKAINIYRVYEVTLYHKLLSKFKLPLETLHDALPFNASYLGQANWNTLLQLPRELYADRNLYIVTDRRLTHSGFLVHLFPDKNGCMTHGEVSQMTPHVGFLGIRDLKEILATISDKPSASLHHSRPLKIQHWIKAEAVRMIRAGPNIVQHDDVMDKLSQWTALKAQRDAATDSAATANTPVDEQDTCIHKKHMFTHLYCLHDLTMSQSQLSISSQGISNIM